MAAARSKIPYVASVPSSLAILCIWATAFHLLPVAVLMLSEIFLIFSLAACSGSNSFSPLSAIWG